MITPNIVQMINDLRNEGFDSNTIARKLELTTVEVENIIYGESTSSSEYSSWAYDKIPWGSHY